MGTREWLRACATSSEKVKAMLDSGMDIQTANANGFTGLHMAASRFNMTVAVLLIESGADVNSEDCNGFTPLDYCVDNANGSKAYQIIVETLEALGGVRRQERCWLKAAN